jgi:hypothetical protein
MPRIALDTNLLILLVVGSVSQRLVTTHKRLAAYGLDDWRLLLDSLGDSEIVITPNAMTEASNLIVQGVREPHRSELRRALRDLICGAEERYARSAEASAAPEYDRLGLADAAWLETIADDTELLTVDLDLYLAASHRGLKARNFNHLRDVGRA